MNRSRIYKQGLVVFLAIFCLVIGFLAGLCASNGTKRDSSEQTKCQCQCFEKQTALETIGIVSPYHRPLWGLQLTPEPSIPAISTIIDNEIDTVVDIVPRYGFTDDEIYLLTVLLSGSKDVDGDGEFDIDFGRSDEYDQISLVLGVVMNRVRSDLYPNSVSDVIWGKNQFEVMPQWKGGLPEVSKISHSRVAEWCAAYDKGDPGVQSIPESHLYFSGDGYKNHSR